MRKILLFILMLLLSAAPLPAQQTRQRGKAATVRKSAPKKSAQKKPAAKKPAATKNATRKKQPQQKKNTASQAGKQPTVKGLQNERRELQAKRAANERRQEELRRSVRRGMENLMILDEEILHKRKVVDTIRNDISQLNINIATLDRQLALLKKELEERRMRYMKSMRYMHRNRSPQDQFLFVFSADNFNQMYRRLRFSREYAAYQRAQGEAVKSKQAQVEDTKRELAESRQAKSTLLARGEKEQQLLEGKQNEQKVQVSQLKKQQKTVEALIVEQQRREEELNARIEQLIAEEIARERARQEAEAKKRRAEAEARRKAAAEAEARQREAAKTKTGSKKRSRDVAATPKTEQPRQDSPAEIFAEPDDDRRLSGSFEQNRGRLPLPITGSYRLVRGFGTYSPGGLSHVRLQSNGWHLKGQPGAKAQCIFDGEVSGVYFQGGSYIVTVRHGRYISAYINLASVSVRKGQRVKTRQTLGNLGSAHTMQFQLRNWSTLLNPSNWIGR